MRNSTVRQISAALSENVDRSQLALSSTHSGATNELCPHCITFPFVFHPIFHIYEIRPPLPIDPLTPSKVPAAATISGKFNECCGSRGS